MENEANNDLLIKELSAMYKKRDALDLQIEIARQNDRPHKLLENQLEYITAQIENFCHKNSL
jgi:acetolactate synthase regulatory subunit